MRKTRDLEHPRDAILRCIERIYRYRMTTTSGGNLSVREASGDIWITPARIDKGSLTRDHIVCCRADGTQGGGHCPSSELPFHRAIYQARPDIRGIVHAHPVGLVAFSIAGLVPDTSVLYQAFDTCGRVSFARYALPGSEALGRNIAEAFAAGADCVVLENHGVVTAGTSLQAAFERFETLEFTAATLLEARQLGTARTLAAEELEIKHRAPAGLALLRAGEATSHEKELRRELSEFVRRAYRQRLMISTEGAFSARLEDDAFLITPHAVDRDRLEPGEIVLVRAGAAEEGRMASNNARVHRAIYARHPEISSIINAYPVSATAFSLTGAPLDARTIPESYLLLRDIQRLPRAVQYSDPDAVGAAASLANPITILENDGVQICGTSVLDAFDRLEVLESTARAIIRARSLGDLVPLSAEAIAELRRAFRIDEHG
jgi:L-fuculose-phosphate aldolase